MRYQVVLHRTDEGISVSVPALPGGWSEDDTDEKALANTRMQSTTIWRLSGINIGRAEVREAKVGV